MEKFGLFGRFTAIQGERDMLAAILLQAARELGAMEECEAYQISFSQEDDYSVFVYEVWTSEEAHKNSLSQESVQALIQQARPLLAGMERMAALCPLGGKGLTD
ncbi:putative quinol monooxygenase [Peribacillus sp. SCS-26]|uniref:putative quinol monooxygenase n=1 Tax=Paraperibacillus marinus TaxID=3115295 RepID=UPI003906AE61